MARIHSIAGVALALAFTSIALGQQGGTQKPKAPPPRPSSSSNSVVRSYAGDISNNSRIVQTQTESAGRSTTTETMEMPGPDGRYRKVRESVTETVGSGTDSVHTDRNVFGTDADGRRKLIETVQADQSVLADGTAREVENTWTPDLNGRLQLTERQVTDERSTGPNVKETDLSIYRPGMNEPLREAERVKQIERQVSKDVVQNETTRFARDDQGRWTATEARNQEIRKTGTETIEEETVRRPDTRGVLNTAERTMTRRSSANGQDSAVTETYFQAASAPVGRLELNERIRVTTTVGADGSQQTIQEVERRNPPSSNEPLRVVERTVETVRPLGANQFETQRQVFGLDKNGRLVPVMTEAGNANR